MDLIENSEIVKTNYNYNAVNNVLSQYKTKFNSFQNDSMSFFDSQIDSIMFTGRVDGGNVDSNDALSSNVINELNKIKLILSSDFSSNFSSFIDSSLKSASSKDLEIYNRKLFAATSLNGTSSKNFLKVNLKD